MGVLDEGTCVAIEVNRLLRVEKHVLAGIDLEDEILEGTHTNNTGCLLLLFLCHVGILACLIANTTGIFHHQLHQVVGIDNGTLTALHLAVGQLYHAIGEVYQFFAPLEAKTVQKDGEHLEVVVLLVAHHINHLVDGVVLEAHLSSTNILRHIY